MFLRPLQVAYILNLVYFPESNESSLTYYTTLVTLADVALRLQNASMEENASLELRTLSAVVGQVVIDACNEVRRCGVYIYH